MTTELAVRLEGLRQLVRENAKSAKGCFTQFSFQAIVFFGAVTGFIAQFQPKNGFAAIAALPALMVLRFVIRVGRFKYESANRALGFDLHQDRVRRLPAEAGMWRPAYLDVGWEELLRVWRFVQPTLFRALYGHSTFFRGQSLRPQFVGKRLWFDIASLADLEDAPRRPWRRRAADLLRALARRSPRAQPESNLRYSAGHFLKRMIRFLHVLSWLCMVPPLAMLVQIHQSACPIRAWVEPAAIVAWLVGCYFLLRANTRDDDMVHLIEGGFLSIHASAVLWHLTVVVHFVALERTVGAAGSLGFDGYTRQVAALAVEIAERPLACDDWLRRTIPPAVAAPPAAPDIPTPG